MLHFGGCPRFLVSEIKMVARRFVDERLLFGKWRNEPQREMVEMFLRSLAINHGVQVGQQSSKICIELCSPAFMRMLAVLVDIDSFHLPWHRLVRMSYHGSASCWVTKHLQKRVQRPASGVGSEPVRCQRARRRQRSLIAVAAESSVRSAREMLRRGAGGSGPDAAGRGAGVPGGVAGRGRLRAGGAEHGLLLLPPLHARHCRPSRLPSGSPRH
jgi:hypothetical protein